jgi:arylsulfatase A-like enzyme
LPVENLQPEGYHPVILGAVPRMVAVSYADEIKRQGWVDTASVVDAYDDLIRSLDASIGAFLEDLRARGLYENAVVLLSADHGETMLEHETYFRHVNNYRENLRVPLVLRLPGGRAAGARVADTVQLVDLYPTLAELAGLSPRSHALHGRSLMPLVEGKQLSPVPVLSQTGIGNADSIVSAGWKLIAFDPAWMSVNQRLSLPQTRRWLAEHHPGFEDVVFGSLGWEEAAARPGAAEALAGAQVFVAGMGIFYELYDLERDPRELRNLAAEEPERLAELLALLERERERAAAARSAVPHDPGQGGVERTKEELEELRKLGYTSGDG